LVVTTEAPLPLAERDVVGVFWRAFWRAGGSAEGEQAARVALAAAVGAARAAALVEETRPFNLNDEPAPPLTRGTVPSSVAFLVLAPATAKDQSWTQAPTVDLLPDRFVLIAEAG